MTVSKKRKYKRFLFCCLRSNLVLFQFWESSIFCVHFLIIMRAASPTITFKRFLIGFFNLQKENTIYLLKGNGFAVNHCKQKCSFSALQQTVISHFGGPSEVLFSQFPQREAPISLSCACSLCAWPQEPCWCISSRKMLGQQSRRDNQLLLQISIIGFEKKGTFVLELSNLFRPRHYSNISPTLPQ